ncbi:MAG: hypothetical protein KKC25_07765 [Proteobacteria bacterium]|nr:hypothetical protein [Pseudomonadota bacterium]
MGAFFAKYRARAGVLLLICLTGYAALGLLWQNIRIYSGLPEKDPVTIHEERILQLKPILSAVGEIGYVTTVENDRIFGFEKSFTNVEYLAQYVLTQYTLAPVIVRNSPAHPVVAGNFLAGPPAAGFIERHGLVPLKDFGDGLILYGRDGKP